MVGTPYQKLQVALYTSSILLATLGLAGRLWARRVTATRWQLNDWLMILAYIHVLGLVITSNLAVTHGEMGVHIWEVPPERVHDVIRFSLKMTIAMPFFMTSASFFVKLSITHFYTVLFPTPRLLARLCRLQLLLLTLCYLAGVIPIFVGCRPLAYTWDRTIPGGQCFDMKNFWMGTSIVAMFFDVTCVVLPIPVLWRLKLERGKKVRLVAVFGLGFFICALSAARIYVHKQVDFADLTYTAAPAMMLTVPEPSLGLVAGCLPIMVPLFAKFARAPSVIVASLSPGWKAGGSGGSASRAGGMGKGSATGTGRTKSTMSVSWLSSKSKSQSASRSCTLPSMRFGDSVDVDMEMMPEYSTTRVVVSRCGDRDEDMVGMFPEPLRATEEMMRELGGRSHWEGITVLREVHVKRGQQWNRSEV